MKNIPNIPSDLQKLNDFIKKLIYLISIQKLSLANIKTEINGFVANFPEPIKSQLAQEIEEEIKNSEIISIENPFI